MTNRCFVLLMQFNPNRLHVTLIAYIIKCSHHSRVCIEFLGGLVVGGGGGGGGRELCVARRTVRVYYMHH